MAHPARLVALGLSAERAVGCRRDCDFASTRAGKPWFREQAARLARGPVGDGRAGGSDNGISRIRKARLEASSGVGELALRLRFASYFPGGRSPRNVADGAIGALQFPLVF